MTAKQLEGLVRLWQGRLGLEAWDLEVEIARVSEGARAETFRSTTYQEAHVRFAPWVIGQGERPSEDSGTSPLDFTTPERLERLVVHELLHLVTRDVRGVIADLEGDLHRDVYAKVEERWQFAEEQAVDRLAAALVRSWPRAT